MKCCLKTENDYLKTQTKHPLVFKLHLLVCTNNIITLTIIYSRKFKKKKKKTQSQMTRQVTDLLLLYQSINFPTSPLLATRLLFL